MAAHANTSKRPKLGPPAKPAPKPKTDFDDWSTHTWECYGDEHGNKCETCWKCPDYPDPICTEDEKDWLWEVIWPRILVVLIIICTYECYASPWYQLWTFLNGAAIMALCVHLSTHKRKSYRGPPRSLAKL